MRAVDTNVVVRLITRDQPKPVAAAETFVAKGAWVSLLALAETTWVLSAVYDRRPEGEGPIWERGGEGYYFLVPFRLSADDKAALRAAAEGGGSTSALVINTMRIRQHPPTPEELKLIHESQQAGQTVPMAGDIGPLPPGKVALPLPHHAAHVVGA